MSYRGLITQAGLVAMFLLLHPEAPQLAPQDRGAVATFRSGVEAVAVDVVVTDRDGRAVSGLTQADFEVLEAGAVRPVTTFAAVDFTDTGSLPSLGDVETDVVTNMTPEGRVFVIALDEITNGSSAESVDGILRTRDLLRRFIRESFGPNDLGAVVLIGRGSVHTGQDFTSSKQRLIRAIDSFSGGFTGETTSAEETLHHDINRIASLRDLVEFLAAMPAQRKALLLFSQRLGDVDVGQVMSNSSRARSLKAFCVQMLPPPGSPNIMSCRPSQDMHALLVAAARGNVAIYPVDPFGLTGAGRDQNFVDLAAATGGVAVTNTNPREWLQQIARENGAYYRLGIESAYTRKDGRMVPIQVRVRRAESTVRTRSGYMAGFPDERRIEATDTTTVSGAVASPIPTRGIPMRVTAPVFKDQNGAGLVPLVLEVDPGPFVGRAANGEASGSMELSWLSTDEHRRVRKGDRHRITLIMKAGSAAQDTARIIVPMSLPKGRHQVRIAVAGAGLTGSIVCDVEVPDFGKENQVLSGIMVSSPLARGVSTFWPAGRKASGPLSWIGTARRDFARSETLAVLGEVYQRSQRRGDGAWGATATLSNGNNEVARTVATLDSRAGEAATSFSLDLPLSGVAPGTYVLAVTAGRKGEPQELVQKLPLRVR